MEKFTRKIIVAAVGLFSICLAGCGKEVISSSMSSVHVHEFAEGSYPCQDRVCLICGETVKATVDHDYVKETVVDPTCTADGYTIYKCSRCGYETKKDKKSKLGHDFVVSSVTDSTCSHVGITTKICSRCGEVEKEYTEKTEHSFDSSLDTVVAPTCTTYGYTSHVCSICGETVKDTIVAPLGHISDGKNDVVTAPTCLEKGYTTHKCGRCGKSFVDSYVDALGHDNVLKEEVKADCTHPSYSVYECKRCQELTYVVGDSARVAHDFTDDNCSTCGKPINQTVFTSLYSGDNFDKPVLMLSNTKFGNIVYSKASEKPLLVNVSYDDIKALVALRYETITFHFGNPDDNLRVFKYKLAFSSTYSSTSTTATQGYDKGDSYFSINIMGSDGSVSKDIPTTGLSFNLIHLNYDDGETVYPECDSFIMKAELTKSFSIKDLSTWVKGDDTSNILYYTSEGWKVSAVSDDDYNFYLKKEVLSAYIAEGYTTLKIRFGVPFTGEACEGNQFDVHEWIIPHKTNGTANWEYKVGWVSGLTLEEDGSYSYTMDLTDTDYDFADYDLQVHLNSHDVDGTYVGVCYVPELSFGGKK